jgi:hypothetical protein
MADVLELENAEEFDADAMDESVSRMKVRKMYNTDMHLICKSLAH